MNEAQTKHDLIEPALREAGWGVIEGTNIRLEFPITQGRLLGQGRRSKPLFADYVLVYKGQRIAVVEAKARDKYYTDGLDQAKEYAERLNIRFTYCTNGLQIYGVDMQETTEGDLTKFPTPQELWVKLHPEDNDWRDNLLKIPFVLVGGKWQPRYYQENAITKVITAIAEGKDRVLLTMATGTGKTGTAFQICWKLFQAKWNLTARQGKNYQERLPRMLFLADRNILADQAFNSFNAFEEDALVRISPSEIRKKGKVPKNGSMFFTIFQTFMSGTSANYEETEDDLEEEQANYEPYFGEYPPDFFDFIIIDECHRGGAKDESSWRAILEYFSPAVQLGLTATPKRDVNADTYAYFGEPVYQYSLKEGINDGFLTPFKVKQIDTTIDNYTFTGDDIVEEGDVKYGQEFKESDFNRTIEIRDREKYRVKLFMDAINQHQKTIVFCATQAHAAFVRDLINQYRAKSNTEGTRSVNYCARVTAEDGARGEQHLRDFQDNEKSIPTILTTSQKLSTGVDAKQVRNIVLLRPVNSMIEFKQIVGRGTRTFDGKDYFTIYDFVKAHEHFKDPEWDGEPIAPEPAEPRGTPKPCSICGQRPCVCERIEEPCPECLNIPCVCDNEPKRKIRIKLSDNNFREIDSMVKTTFWSASGTPISSEQFIQELFGDLPSLFKNEDELRKIWSKPETRKRLLEELEEKGYSKAQLQDLQKIVHGEESDLYDVLSYIAYHKNLLQRSERAGKAKIHFNSYNPNQQTFLNFVLEQYVKSGVDELAEDKLPDLLELKYKGIQEAKKELGEIKTIRDTFIGFQEYLYGNDAV